MLVVIAGGGTGGHVFPAMAVGQEFEKRGDEIVYIGTKSGFEARVIPQTGWRIEYLSTPRWKGQSFVTRVVALLRIPFAVLKARKLLKKVSPDIVIGVGGYASAPVLMAAFLRRIPSVIMEQNAIPGVTNRKLSRFVKKIFVSFPDLNGVFNKSKVLETGNPVRKEILDSIMNEKREEGVGDKFCVLCFGGSQGARSINEALLASMKYLRDVKDEIKIVHQVGKSIDLDVAKDIYEREGFEAEVLEFIDDMASRYKEADLIICRAGATSIWELTIAGKPSVLVPYPYAADNHQEANARYLSDNGGALLVLDKEMSGEKVAEIIKNLFKEPVKLQEMGEAVKKMAKPNAAKEIVDECYRLAS